MNPGAQISGPELEFLKKIAGKNHVIIEIGCYAGRSTLWLAEHNKVIAIDPLIPGYDPRDKASKDMKGVEELLLSNIKGKNIIWHKEKSEVILKNWSTPIDGIFIDGEHTAEALTIDLGWIKHVRPDGFMIFHDYGSYPEVKILLDKEVLPRYKIIGRCHLLIAFKK